MTPEGSDWLNLGMEFEKRILANEKNNLKFNFLLPNDPYNSYYKTKVIIGLLFFYWRLVVKEI